MHHLVWGHLVRWFGRGAHWRDRPSRPMYKVWGEKIENFFFVSNSLKTFINGFWMCFENFFFSRSANPLHDPCIRYGGKKIVNFFLVSNGFKMILK